MSAGTQQAPKTRVLFVIDDMGVGGAQKQIQETVNRLDPKRFETGIVCLHESGPMAENAGGARDFHVLGAHRVFDNRAVAAVASLARIIRDGRYDVVEAYLPAAHFLCAVALAAGGKTALVAARRNLASLDPAWYRFASRLLRSATHLSIANSLAVKESVTLAYRLDPSQVAVVGNVVEFSGASISMRSARLKLGVSEDRFVVAAAGTLSKVKNHAVAVRALASLRGMGVPATLLIAGDGPEERALVSLKRRLGLNGEVKLLGATSDVRTMLAAADVFVHPSRSEGCSNALLEAAAASLPPVVSNIAANREVLNEAAYYFEPDDWRGCLAGLLHFARNTDHARQVGLAATAVVKSRFDPDEAIAAREKIYSELAGRVQCRR